MGRLRSGTSLAMVAMTVVLGVALVNTSIAAARTVNVTESASLHLVRKSGSTLYQSGSATGTLTGPVQTRFIVTLTRVTGVFTIFPRGGGSVTFSVDGAPQTAGLRAKFAARLTVLGGTGRYKSARGSGHASGTVHRRKWWAKVSATGRLSF